MNTKVIDINHHGDHTNVSLDLSANANLHWSRPIYSGDNNGDNKVIFYGSSCFEDDIVCSVNTNDTFKVGQSVNFWNISPYSYSWNNSFNGIKKIKCEFINQ